MSNAIDPTRRFAARVDFYVRSRPSYPQALIDFLFDHFKLQESSVVADIGSGTGILAKLFLDCGNAVIGVEPNDEMRIAGEQFLESYPLFRSVAGSAEETTLPEKSVDLIVAGQAFHWFNPELSAVELGRIGRTESVALIWNERRKSRDGFDARFDDVIEQFTSEREVAAIRGGSVGVEPKVERFFGRERYSIASFDNYQRVDWNGLLDRVYSSSYMPLPDDPTAPDMEKALRVLFDRYAVDGRLQVNYETRCFYSSWH